MKERKSAGKCSPQLGRVCVASNPNNLVPTAILAAREAGVSTFQQNFNNGQVWVQVKNGYIFFAGRLCTLSGWPGFAIPTLFKCNLILSMICNPFSSQIDFRIKAMVKEIILLP